MSLSRAVDRLLGLLTFGRVGRSRQTAGAIGEVWLERLGEADKHQHWQPYGFASAPKDGSHAVVAAIGSHGNQRIALLVGDRRYTIALEAGEVAVVDDLGQKVHLTRTGIVIDAPTIKLGGSASLGVARATDAIDMGDAGTAGTWAFWAAAVATATSTTPPTVAPVIDAGSSVVKAE